jgi:hypothetical protein
MTELKTGSKVTRKTAIEVQRKPLVITLHPGYLDIRQAKTRSGFSLSYDALYRYAAKLAADKVVAEKKLAKKAHKE